VSELPEITEVERLTLRPGDRLAVHVDAEIDAETAAYIQLRVQAVLGVEFPVIVLSRGFGLKVLSPETEEKK
jgi:hypothetical protein